MKISWGQNHLQFSYLVWGEERGVFGVIFSVSFIAGLGHKLSDIDIQGWQTGSAESAIGDKITKQKKFFNR